jgi:hypothetical protein
MEEETYIKVYINTIDDLPKVQDDYFVCRSGFRTTFEFIPGKSEMVWKKEVRWYLRPNKI